MEKNNKPENLMEDKMVVGVGLGMIAALSAGAYYLYGTKEGAKKRVKIRGWMLKAKGEVMEKMESLKEVNEETYNALIQSVMKKYESLKNIDPIEVTELTNDMKKHWKNIKRHINVAKPALSSGVKKGVKKIAKKVDNKQSENK